MSLGTGALWATLGNWIQQGFSLLTVLVLARLLEPASFGVMATALLLVLLGQRVLLEGISYFIIQLDTLTDEALSTTFWSAIGVGMLSAAALVLLARPLASLFSMPSLSFVLPALAVIPLLDGLASVHTGLLRREAKFRQLAKRTLLAGTLGCVAGISVALLGGGIKALIVQQVVQAIGNCLAALGSHSWRPQLVFRPEPLRRLLRFGLPMSGNALVYVGLNRMDIALLGGFAGPAATGIYSMAKRLARAVTDLLVTGVSAAGLTAMASVKTDSQQTEHALKRSLRLASWLSFPAFALLGYFGPAVLPHVLGTIWSTVGDSLLVLCLFGAVQVPVLVGSNLFVALGQSSRLAVQSTLSMFVFLVAVLFMRPISASSIALAFLTQGVAAAFIFAVQLSATGLSPFRIFASVLGAACATALALLAVWGWSRASIPELPLLFENLMQMLMFFAVYIGASFVTNRAEVSMIFGRMRGRSK